MLFTGVAGLALTRAERQYLRNPLCAGVILFARNFTDAQQLQALCAEIHAVRGDLLIGVDQEGGRVQRFVGAGFTRLASASYFGRVFEQDAQLALRLIYANAVVMSYELLRVGVDFNLAPVLDLQDAVSTVIGERAFHRQAWVVAQLALAQLRGMRAVGMAAVGKHFPGHGRVVGDSHLVLPHDARRWSERAEDIYPFRVLIQAGIPAMMPAHIVFPEDSLPAGFSPYFLNRLRKMGFDGAILSDDLDMAGAQISACANARVSASLTAGADAALICNRLEDSVKVLSDGVVSYCATRYARLQRSLSVRLRDERQVFTHYQAAKRFLFAHEI